jgi:hypothetical protein
MKLAFESDFCTSPRQNILTSVLATPLMGAVSDLSVNFLDYFLSICLIIQIFPLITLTLYPNQTNE